MAETTAPAAPAAPFVRVPMWLVSVLGAIVVAAAAFTANTVLRVEALFVRVEYVERVAATAATKADVERLERQYSRIETKLDAALNARGER